MGVPEWIAVASVVIAFLSFAVQQHLTRKHARIEARTKHYERTATLLLAALDAPDLLKAIGGESKSGQRERRFRQLWLNHIEVFFREQDLYERAHWEGTLFDIRSFMNTKEMREHWNDHSQYYAKDFQAFIDQKIIQEEAEPRPSEAPLDEAHASTT